MPTDGRNRLADEASPYLLQHADNPVHWWPWGAEAKAEALRRDVPLFISIGYATCHWCHVMAHESFEDDEVAARMNEAFVCVKIDREERPDLDDAYMAACQLMNGSGGWPLTILALPDGKPFFAGTYYPKTTRPGRIGMMDLVPRAVELWREQRDDVVGQAGHLTEHIGKAPAAGDAPVLDLIPQALGQLTPSFDPVHGGFGGAPKFPMPSTLLLLASQARHDEQARNMLMTSLAAMRRGGIWDHVGGGFHRYSTDAQWLLPHFEKMLYDQAMLALVYTRAWQITGEPWLEETVRAIFAYVRRDLATPTRAFASAEDADSEGEEGKFYVWTTEELQAVLPGDGAFLARFNAAAEGNFLDEATRKRTGANILHLDREADLAGPGDDAVLERLRVAREKRVRPLLDDKVLVDWNGLMVAALSAAGRAFGDDELVAEAASVADSIHEKMAPDGRLRHRLRGSALDEHAFLDDYAMFAWGLIELYDATLEPRWLAAAKKCLDDLLEHHLKDGVLHVAPLAAGDAFARRVTATDGALPSGNSVAAYALARMFRLTADSRYDTACWGILSAFGEDVKRHPTAYGFLLQALQVTASKRDVVIVGAPADLRTKALLAAARKLDDATILLRDPGHAALDQVAPWLAAYDVVDGAPAAYVCVDRACQLPVTDPKKLA